MAPDTPAALAALEPAARGFIAAECAAGKRVLQVLAPPAGIVASTYVILQRPGGDGTPGEGVSRSFGELAPGLPAVVVLEHAPVESDPAPVPPPAPPPPPVRPRRPPTAPTGPTVDRFVASMRIDYERWHDGIGYDLAAIDEATPAERAQMLALLRSRGLADWRDVQAAARIGGPDARRALRQLLRSGSIEQRLALMNDAPELFSDAQRTTTLVQALQQVRPFAGLSDCLAQVQRWHPAPVMAALWAAAECAVPERAVHAAALLAYLHGLAAAPFDFDQRPFFLRFGDPDPATRAEACAELRRRIGAAAGAPVNGPG